MPITAPLRRTAAAAALALACLTGCQGGDPSGTILTDLIAPLVPPSPSQAARNAFNPYDADKRARSVALLSAAPFGGEDPYLRTYRLLIDDPDATVRAAAIKALGAHGTVDDAALILPHLRDDAAFVRWQAAKALQRIHHPDAAGPLMDAMKSDDDADVRMAAADALGQYPQPGVFDALVGVLTDPNYAVVRAAADSLETLTGQPLDEDPSAWLAWARGRRGQLFAHQQPYRYQPYTPPPGLLDKMQFWSDAEPNPPKAPVGLSPTGTSNS